MRSGVLVLALCACGQVNKAPVDAAQDAFQPDGPPVCGSGEMLCGTGCENVMTSNAHCGGCTTACNAIEGCLAGSCVVATRSCETIKALDPNAPSALYTNASDNTFFYCDMTAKVQYQDLAIYTTTTVLPTGVTQLRATDFDTAGKGAFVALYNRPGGVKATNIHGILNCCFEVGTAIALRVGGQQVLPAFAGATACLADMDGVYQFTVNGAVQPPNLPPNYFDTMPVTEMPGACTDNVNPTWAWKKTPF